MVTTMKIQKATIWVGVVALAAFGLVQLQAQRAGAAKGSAKLFPGLDITCRKNVTKEAYGSCEKESFDPEITLVNKYPDKAAKNIELEAYCIGQDQADAKRYIVLAYKKDTIDELKPRQKHQMSLPHFSTRHCQNAVGVKEKGFLVNVWHANGKLLNSYETKSGYSATYELISKLRTGKNYFKLTPNKPVITLKSRLDTQSDAKLESLNKPDDRPGSK